LETFFDSEILGAYTADIFVASGSSLEEAQIVTDHLIDANLVGHDSHGVIRVVHYLQWLKKGWVKANAEPTYVTDSGSVLVLDGGFGYGQVTAKAAMKTGIDRAKANGVCLVATRNCSHVGRVGAWAEEAAKSGLVSLHFVNTSGFGIRIAPFGGKEARFSTNPICIGTPVESGEPVILDMSTGQIPEGKILVAINKGETLPEGMIIDGSGNPTVDPQGFFDEPQGSVLPVGGPKGSGLAFMIEVLAGALTGGKSGHPDNETANMVVNNMFSILIDPEVFSSRDAYGIDVNRLIEWTKSSMPTQPNGQVLVPGELESKTRRARLKSGIPLDELTISEISKVASTFGIATPLLKMAAS